MEDNNIAVEGAEQSFDETPEDITAETQVTEKKKSRHRRRSGGQSKVKEEPDNQQSEEEDSKSIVDKKKKYKQQWYPGNTLHFSIGQSFLMLTPLQVA